MSGIITTNPKNSPWSRPRFEPMNQFNNAPVTPEPVRKSTPAGIALAWIVVMVPLGWGVYESVVKSLPLFQSSPAAPSAPSSAK
jgi:hypothetical protein